MAEAAPRPRVLFVDDEENVLHGIARLVRNLVDAELATSAPAAARLLEKSVVDGASPFAAIVSDMRMPLMDGAVLLKHANEVAPDTTRLLLTGYTDLPSAIAAVNDGNIFRVLTKPCQPAQMHSALKAAIKQHELVRDHRDLLDRTLRGAVEALTETLSMAHPAASARASRLGLLVRQVCDRLQLPDVWRADVAAQLCEIGVMTLPPEALVALETGEPRSIEIARMLDALPGVANGVLSRIPRMEEVSEIVGAQYLVDDPNPSRLARANQAARVLQAVREYDALIMLDHQPDVAVHLLRRRAHLDCDVVDALQVVVSPHGLVVREMDISQLETGMVLGADLRTSTGVLLANQGQLITEEMLAGIHNFAASAGLDGRPYILGALAGQS